VADQEQSVTIRPDRKLSAEELRALAARHEMEWTLGWSMPDVHRLLTRAFDGRINCIGITRQHLKIVMELRRHEAQGGPGLTQTELAELVDMEKAPLGKALDRLEAGGWIERRPDATDRRVNRVVATGKIDPMLPQLLPIAREVFDMALAGLSPAEVKALMAILDRMKANLEAADRVRRGG